MRAFNYVRAAFADGDDYVSDAPERLVAEIELGLEALAPLAAPADDGVAAFRGGTVLAYVRGGPARRYPGGARFVHAVAVTGGDPEDARRARKALQRRYGPEPGPRIDALCGRLRALPLTEAARELAEHFVTPDPPEDPMPETRPGRRTEKRAPAAGASATLGWVLATLGAAAAGFFGARSLDPALLPGSLPSVSAPPASVGAAPDESDLEVDRLRAELERERGIRKRAIAALELEQLGMANRLAALESEDIPAAISGLAAAPAIGETAFVDASTLWVRAGPGPEHDGVGRLRRGARVRSAREPGPSPAVGWTQIEAPLEGWVATRFLSAEPPGEAP